MVMLTQQLHFRIVKPLGQIEPLINASNGVIQVSKGWRKREADHPFNLVTQVQRFTFCICAETVQNNGSLGHSNVISEHCKKAED